MNRQHGRRVSDVHARPFGSERGNGFGRRQRDPDGVASPGSQNRDGKRARSRRLAGEAPTTRRALELAGLRERLCLGQGHRYPGVVSGHVGDDGEPSTALVGVHREHDVVFGILYLSVVGRACPIQGRSPSFRVTPRRGCNGDTRVPLFVMCSVSLGKHHLRRRNCANGVPGVRPV